VRAHSFKFQIEKAKVMRQVLYFLLLLPLFLLAFLVGTKAQHRPVKWAVQKNSTLSVGGSSNVNHFTCTVTSLASYDTIVVLNDAVSSLALKGSIKMNVLSFDCNNNLIRKDLRKTLKWEEHPNMVIRFLTLKTMPGLTFKTEQISGWVEVELAGVKKVFELHYTFTKAATGSIRLNGGRKFCFSDFSLAPPRKLAGLVKIRDEFDVKFELMLKPV